jgi:hypothetical protein
VAAGTIGLELYDGVDPEAAGDVLRALDSLGALLSAFDALPSVAVRAFRNRARRAAARASR